MVEQVVEVQRAIMLVMVTLKVAAPVALQVLELVGQVMIWLEVVQLMLMMEPVEQGKAGQEIPTVEDPESVLEVLGLPVVVVLVVIWEMAVVWVVVQLAMMILLVKEELLVELVVVWDLAVELVTVELVVIREVLQTIVDLVEHKMMMVVVLEEQLLVVEMVVQEMQVWEGMLV